MKTPKLNSFVPIALSLLLAASGAAQSPPTPDLSQSFINSFDLHDTNSLVNAREINLTPVFKWDSANSQAGGGVKIDWWISDQQGAWIGYDEFGDRSSYTAYGYQARTVFKNMEVALALGVSQNNDDPFGNVKLAVTPTFTIPVVKSEKWDIRISFGADLTSGAKPNPFLGLTFRALKF